MKLMIQTGTGYRAAKPAEIAEAYSVVVRAEFNKERPAIHSALDAVRVLRDQLAGLDHEVFVVLFLNTRLRLIEVVEMFRGTIDGSTVHPREVVKETLNKGAAAVMFAHNHPSGVAEASQADDLITARLREAMALIDVRVVDHIIIAGTKYYSFAEHGLL